MDEDPDGDLALVALSLRFPGQLHDTETGLYYNRYRDYDPATGRYVQVDPIGLLGGLNPFAYVGSRPTISIDPMGLFNPFTSFGDWGAEAHTAMRQSDRNIREMQDADTQGADKYFHCKAHCEAQQEGLGGTVVSHVGGIAREARNLGSAVYRRKLLFGPEGELSDMRRDMRANAAGRSAARSGEHCATACRNWTGWLPARYDSEAHKSTNDPAPCGSDPGLQ